MRLKQPSLVNYKMLHSYCLVYKCKHAYVHEYRVVEVTSVSVGFSLRNIYIYFPIFTITVKALHLTVYSFQRSGGKAVFVKSST